MYAHKDSAGRVTTDFLNGAEIFMYQAGKTSLTQETGKMFCPCRKCKTIKFAQSETVWKNIVNRGFTPHYYIWFTMERMIVGMKLVVVIKIFVIEMNRVICLLKLLRKIR